MNESMILGMIGPHIKENALTYKQFEQIFSMLSLREQYGILDILYKNNIELVDNHSYSKANSNSFEQDSVLIEPRDFENDMFSDSSDELTNLDNSSDELTKYPITEFLKTRDKIYLDNKTLVKMIQDGDAQAKQDLCVKNRRLVTKEVSRYQGFFRNKLEFEDLEQAGMLGMLRAAEKFDFRKGTEFSTYAMWWIKQAITREIMDNGFTVRIPVHRMEQIYRVMSADSKFGYESDYNNRVRLISEATEMPIVLVEECLLLYHRFIQATSLETPVGEEEDTLLIDLIPIEEEESVEDIIIRKNMRDCLDKALILLNDKERRVLLLRFGFEDGRIWTLEEIGNLFGVTRERIRQVEAKAIRKLRLRTRNWGLDDFLE